MCPNQCRHRILAGSRPYWWVNETDLFTNLTRPVIRQTYLTCETTAGNPSGHVMFSASILFFVIRSIFYQSPWLRRYLNKPFKFFLWNIYVSVLGLISISRMFFACHFFHQCVLGSCFGITISQFLQNRKVERFLIELNRLKGFLLGCILVVVCIAVYYAHYLIAEDPQWAVKKVFIVQPINLIDVQTFGLNLTFSFCHKLGVQLVQRSVQFHQTGNNANLFIDSWIWLNVWPDFVFASIEKVNRCDIVYFENDISKPFGFWQLPLCKCLFSVRYAIYLQIDGK